jgi:hypothetical protein
MATGVNEQQVGAGQCIYATRHPVHGAVTDTGLNGTAGDTGLPQ